LKSALTLHCLGRHNIALVWRIALRPRAQIDFDSPLLAGSAADRGRLRVGATTGPADSPLERADFVRIDPSSLSLHEICRVREDQHAPALLDLPGARTRLRNTVLTRSEFLLYAATESYHWVNLRDIQSDAELIHARQLLPESVRLTASVRDIDSIQSWPSRWWQHMDGLILDCADLGHGFCDGEFVNAIEVALLSAQLQEVPCYFLGPVLPSLNSQTQPRIEEIGRLAHLAGEGCAGIILSELPEDSEDAQLAVDVLCMVAQHCPSATTMPGSSRRAAARIGVAHAMSPPDRFIEENSS
jgi:hypothetical protein